MKLIFALLLSVIAHGMMLFTITNDLPPLIFNGGQSALVIALNIVEVQTQQEKQQATPVKVKPIVEAAPQLTTTFNGEGITAKKVVTAKLADNISADEAKKSNDKPVEKKLTEQITEKVVKLKESKDANSDPKVLSQDSAQMAQIATAKYHAKQLSLTKQVINVTAPSIFKAPRPKLIYPKRAKRRGYQGQALVTIELSISGEIAKLSLSQSSGYQLLDKAALHNVAQWQFNPVLQHGIAIRARFEVPINFFLHT